MPSFEETLEYRDQVLEAVTGSISEENRYFVELAVRHEEMHAEAFHYTRQTLGYPDPGLGAPEQVTNEEDIELPGGVFRLGSRPNGFVFDNEKTRRYREIFEKVHRGKLDLNELREKAGRFDQLAALGGRRLPTAARVLLALVVLGAAALAYQLFRKPTEILAVVPTSAKLPAQTWDAYGALFREHATDLVSPELLAALVQTESGGDPLAHDLDLAVLVGHGAQQRRAQLLGERRRALEAIFRFLAKRSMDDAIERDDP